MNNLTRPAKISTSRGGHAISGDRSTLRQSIGCFDIDGIQLVDCGEACDGICQAINLNQKHQEFLAAPGRSRVHQNPPKRPKMGTTHKYPIAYPFSLNRKPISTDHPPNNFRKPIHKHPPNPTHQQHTPKPSRQKPKRLGYKYIRVPGRFIKGHYVPGFKKKVRDSTQTLSKLERAHPAKMTEARSQWKIFRQQKGHSKRKPNLYSPEHISKLGNGSNLTKEDFLISFALTPTIKNFCHESQTCEISYTDMQVHPNFEMIQRSEILPVENVKSCALPIAIAYMYMSLRLSLTNMANEFMSLIGYRARSKRTLGFFKPWAWLGKTTIPRICSPFTSKSSMQKQQKRPTAPAWIQHPNRTLLVLTIFILFTARRAKATDLNQHRYKADIRNNFIFNQMGTATINPQTVTYSVKYVPCEKIRYLSHMKTLLDTHALICKRKFKITNPKDYDHEIEAQSKVKAGEYVLKGSYTLLTDRLDFMAAQKACKRLGLTLLEIHNNDEKDAVATFMSKQNLTVVWANIELKPMYKELVYGSGKIVNPTRPFESAWTNYNNETEHKTLTEILKDYYIYLNDFLLTYHLQEEEEQRSIRLYREQSKNLYEVGPDSAVGKAYVTNVICEKRSGNSHNYKIITDSWRKECNKMHETMTADYDKVATLIDSVMPYKFKSVVNQKSALYFGQDIYTLKNERLTLPTEAPPNADDLDQISSANSSSTDTEPNSANKSKRNAEDFTVTSNQIKDAWKNYTKDWGMSFDQICEIADKYEKDKDKKFEIDDGLKRERRIPIMPMTKVLLAAIKMGALIYEGVKFFNGIKTHSKPNEALYYSKDNNDLRKANLETPDTFDLPFESINQENLENGPPLFITLANEQLLIIHQFYRDHDYLSNMGKMLHRLAYDLNFRPDVSMVLNKRRMKKIADTIEEQVDIKVTSDPTLVKPVVQTTNASFILILPVPIVDTKKEATLFSITPIPLFQNGIRYNTNPTSKHVAFFNSESRYVSLSPLEMLQCITKPYCQTANQVRKVSIQDTCGISEYSKRFSPRKGSSCVYFKDQDQTTFTKVFQDKIIVSSDPKKTKTFLINCLSKNLQDIGNDGVITQSGVSTLSIPWSCRATLESENVDLYPQLMDPRSDIETANPVTFINESYTPLGYSADFKVRAIETQTMIIFSTTIILFIIIALAASTVAYYIRKRNHSNKDNFTINPAQLEIETYNEPSETSNSSSEKYHNNSSLTNNVAPHGSGNRNDFRTREELMTLFSKADMKSNNFLDWNTKIIAWETTMNPNFADDKELQKAANEYLKRYKQEYDNAHSNESLE